MAVLYKPSLDPSRVYYGTDTRALELLVGAALAMFWPSRKLRTATAPEARRVLDGLGALGRLVIFLMFWRSSEFSHRPLAGHRARRRGDGPPRHEARPDRRLQADALGR